LEKPALKQNNRQNKNLAVADEKYVILDGLQGNTTINEDLGHLIYCFDSTEFHY